VRARCKHSDGGSARLGQNDLDRQTRAAAEESAVTDRWSPPATSIVPRPSTNWKSSRSQEEIAFYADRESKDVPKIGQAALAARAGVPRRTAIIFDTAGRLQIDLDLIEEVKRLRATVQPDEILLVADGALGQEAVNVARTFHEALS
jgi:hypothetical protein